MKGKTGIELMKNSQDKRKKFAEIYNEKDKLIEQWMAHYAAGAAAMYGKHGHRLIGQKK